MNKQGAVTALGQQALTQPTRLREALKANDRLKLYLTVLQVAAAHAAAPERPAVDLAADIAAADIHDRDEAAWLREAPTLAAREGSQLVMPGWARLRQRLGTDLLTMAAPVLDDVDADPAIDRRFRHWTQVLAQGLGEGGADSLGEAELAELTRGRREAGDSLHLLVMDLHKALNRMAVRLKGETIAGAHTWGLAPGPDDAACVQAFMRGLERTRAAKGDHPGLDTTATRDGERLLIQNDIGTNDAHVLVMQVQGLALSVTYSDLHRTRFDFFRATLAETGATWSDMAQRTTAGLNNGEAYCVGTARWAFADTAALHQGLEAVGARIVFLIDWNRARKRLQAFVSKDMAVAVLRETTRREVGHRAWLVAGAERLVWNAMAAQGENSFRLGDRLDQVLGAEAARDWLMDVLTLAANATRRRQSAAYIADEARLLLARRLRGLHGGAELLQEHAAWCHALAQALRDGLAHGVERDEAGAGALAARAKVWERQADELVVQARARAERRPAEAPQARLLQQADDVADALEEACFVLSLVALHPRQRWGDGVRGAMQALADAVLAAVQDHVKAVAISTAGLADDGDADAAIDALWRVMQAERQCDELLRSARRELAREMTDPAALLLGNELAAALELATDHLLALGHALRRHTLDHEGLAP